MSLMKELEALARNNPSIGKAMGSILEKYSPRVFEPRPPRRRDIAPSDGEAKVKFIIKPLPDDFRELRPGTHEWGRYWREHREKQEEMLSWKSKAQCTVPPSQ